MDRPPIRQRGSTTVEAVLAVPALIFVVMVVVQAGLWFHGAHLVEAAAQEGVRAGRVEGGTAAEAEQRARQFVTKLSPSIAGTSTVAARRSAERTRVIVSGTVQAVVPGLELTVTGSAEAPTERFRTDR